MKFYYLFFLALLPILAFSQPSATEYRLDSLHRAAFKLLMREDYRRGIPAAEACLSEAEANQERYPRYYARALELQMVYKPNEINATFQKVKTFRQEKLGENDSDYARTLVTEAMRMRGQGKIPEAIPIMERAMELTRRDSGENCLFYASLMNRYATLLQLAGNYLAAETNYKKALVIQKGGESGRIRDTLAYASTLLDIGSFYNDRGRLKDMEMALTECRDLRRAACGEKTVAYAQALNNLAVYYSRTGQRACARSAFEDVVRTTSARRTLQGALLDSLSYGAALNNLGNACQQTNAFTDAGKYLHEALNIRALNPGKKHPSYYSTVLSLGKLMYLQDSLQLAEQYWLEVKAWVQGGKRYTTAAALWQNLAQLYLESGRPTLAWQYFQEALKVNRDSLGLLPYHPEIIRNLRGLASARPGSPEGTAAIIEADTLALRYLREQARFSSEYEMQEIMRTMLPDFEGLFGQLLENGSPEIMDWAYDSALALKETLLKNAAAMKKAKVKGLEKEYNDWRDARKKLAKGQGLTDEQKKTLPLEIGRLEKVLAGVLPVTPVVHWQEVQQRLKPGEVAIEFIEFRRPAKVSTERNEPTRYAALVLRKGDAHPQKVLLCPKKDLQALWHSYEASCQDDDCSVEAFNNLYGYERPDGTLYSMLWQPLEKLLGEKPLTIYYSPTGYINLFNLRAIHRPNEDYLPHNFITLSSTGNLKTSLQDDTSLLPTHAVIFGGIDPEANGADTSMWKEATELTENMRKVGASCSHNTGTAATENTFFTACEKWDSSAQVLIHMAVHGRWLVGQEDRRPSGECGLETTDDPMFNSYLELRADLPSGTDFGSDGKATAYDISQLDFSQVALVYLSSCHTGLGEVRGFEGIFGLQRALKIAGAQKIIVCLNGVPTSTTRDMTRRFYQKWLFERKSIRKAFQEAQEEMRQQNALPCNWATFMLIE